MTFAREIAVALVIVASAASCRSPARPPQPATPDDAPASGGTPPGAEPQRQPDADQGLEAATPEATGPEPSGDRSPVMAIAAGERATCALRESGAVWCWGSNNHGELGSGIEDRHVVVARVADLDDAVEIGVGLNGGCARRRSGEVACWGTRGAGRLGDGVCGPRSFSRAGLGATGASTVPGVTQAVEIAVGDFLACARVADGRVLCWGGGDPDAGPRCGDPTEVPGLNDAVQVEASTGHACARRAVGVVLCWGDNQQGQLGPGPDIPLAAARPLRGIDDAAEIALGPAAVCVRSARGVRCLGEWIPRSPRIDGWTDLEPRHDAVCGIRPDETAACLDRGGVHSIRGLSNAVEIALGQEHGCALRSDGEVVCWGENGSYALGTRDPYFRPEPAPVEVLSQEPAGPPEAAPVPLGIDEPLGAVQMDSYGPLTCVVRESGEVVCWGCCLPGYPNDSRQGSHGVPVLVPGVADAVEVQVGQGFACVRRRSGRASCWGENALGQLGDGTNIAREAPVEVLDLTDATRIELGRATACAIRAVGGAVCWGVQWLEASGDVQGAAEESAPPRLSARPVQIPSSEDTVDLAASCLIDADGDASCFDIRNLPGGAGASDAPTPRPVPALGRVSWLSVADNDIYAIRRDGLVGYIRFFGGAEPPGGQWMAAPPGTLAINQHLLCLRADEGIRCRARTGGSDQGSVVLPGAVEVDIGTGPCGRDAAGHVFCAENLYQEDHYQLQPPIPVVGVGTSGGAGRVGTE